MLKAKDFRYYAREALRGCWLKAGATGVVAGLLGASINVGNYVTSFSGSATDTNEIITGNTAAGAQIPASVFAVIMGIVLIFLVWAIVIFIIGGATTLGYAKYNLNIIDDNDPKLGDIFSQYHRLGTGFGMQFFRALFTFLWSLLLVIPGIIASYRYYMTPFILVENPGMTAREAINESKELMKGNKWRLFCLEFSFIGWELLAGLVMWVAIMITLAPILVASMSDSYITEGTVISLIIAMFVLIIVFIVAVELFLSPYIMAAITAFYREIRDQKYSNPHIEEEAVEFTDNWTVEDVICDPDPLAKSQEHTEE